MAMAANPPLSPPPSVATSTSAADNGDASPQTRRRNLSSPWAQVVRGVEAESTAGSGPRSPSSPSLPPMVSVWPEQTPFTVCSGRKAPAENSPPEAQPESSDNSDGNVGRPKKPAWNKPVNGVVEPSSVMGGSVSWPALSESARPTTKSSSDPSKPVSDGSASSPQEPLISQTPQKQVNTNSNHGMHRQRSMKHRGGGVGSGSGPGGGSAQGGYNRPPPPPPPLPPAFPVIEIPPYGNYGNFMPPPVLDSPARGPRPMGGVGPQSGNDHSSHSQRNSSRRNNFGPRPRGDGQYHNNHGGRRDSDRRDVQVPYQFIPPPGSYIPPPPPPGSAPFLPPPHMRPVVGAPMGGRLSFDMASPFVYVPTLPPEPFRGMPLIAQAPPAPMFFPVIDPPLPALIIKQIDYYFSDANLVKDDYLRSNMDDEGWVPISLIASFPRVQQLTTDIQLILDSLRASVIVEVKEQGDMIRRRNEWWKWVHTGGRVSPDPSQQTPGTSSDDNLPTSIENLSLTDDSITKTVTMDSVDSQMEMVPSRPLPEESRCSSNVDNGEFTAEEVRSRQT